MDEFVELDTSAESDCSEETGLESEPLPQPDKAKARASTWCKNLFCHKYPPFI